MELCWGEEVTETQSGDVTAKEPVYQAESEGEH